MMFQLYRSRPSVHNVVVLGSALALVVSCGKKKSDSEGAQTQKEAPASEPAPETVVAPSPAPKPAVKYSTGDVTKDTLKAFLSDPRTSIELAKHVEWHEGLSYGPCDLPKTISKEQFLADIVATMGKNLDELWTQNELEGHGEPLYALGKYGLPADELSAKYYDANEGWEGGVGCFDSEPFGEALSETWEAL